MVYSTCTFNRQEDEDMLSYLIEELGAEPVALPELPEPNHSITSQLLSLLPYDATSLAWRRSIYGRCP